MTRPDDLDSIPPGTIVQSCPTSHWGACLVVINSVRPWGIMGYTTMPFGKGDAWIRLTWEEIEMTGGLVIWGYPDQFEEQ
jgi:hypothetical protein